MASFHVFALVRSRLALTDLLELYSGDIVDLNGEDASRVLAKRRRRYHHCVWRLSSAWNLSFGGGNDAQTFSNFQVLSFLLR